MGEYGYPGVYTERVSRQQPAIAGLSSSTGVFVGLTERGQEEKAALVTSFSQYLAKFGNIIAESFLPDMVYQFFDKGRFQFSG